MLRKPQIKQMGQTMKILFYNLWSVELKQHHITNNQIIVPATVTNRFLEIAHQQHQGITKTKAMLRTKVCLTCQTITYATSSRQPLQMTSLPTQNWEYLSIDLKGPLESGKYVLAVIGYWSKYSAVALMQSITLENIKQLYKKSL